MSPKKRSRNWSSPIHQSNRSPRMYTAAASRAGPAQNARNAAASSCRSGDRCRSDRNSRGFIAAAAGASGDDFGLADHDVLHRDVLVEAAAAGRDTLDGVDDVGALDDLAEHRVPPALRARALVVEEVVVGDVDEELRGRRV